jgi:hypothetical protein
MSEQLTNQIVKHVLDNVGITDEKQVSILQFLTDKTIQFDVEDGELATAEVWACQTLVDNVRFRMMYSHLDGDMIFVSKLDECPTYGCSLIIDNEITYNLDGFIGLKMNDQNWIPTTIFLQATFLAGMEQLKDLSGGYSKCSDHEDLLSDLKSFISFKENQ